MAPITKEKDRAAITKIGFSLRPRLSKGPLEGYYIKRGISDPAFDLPKAGVPRTRGEDTAEQIPLRSKRAAKAEAKRIAMLSNCGRWQVLPALKWKIHGDHNGQRPDHAKTGKILGAKNGGDLTP